jgi:hypothetical protein
MCYNAPKMEDCMDDIATKPTAKINAKEIERRRKIVRQADANNRIEGIFREPATDAIVEAFVTGDIEVTEMIPHLKGLAGPR